MNISGFEKAICITDFILEKRVNSHSYCKFTALIKFEDSKEFLSLVGKTTKISHNGKNVLFGIVNKIEIFNKISSCYIETDIISVSYVTDVDTYTRIFQNPKKKLSEVIKSIEYKSAEIYKSCVSSTHNIDIVDNQVANEIIDFPIVQLNETDFQFLLRLANFYDCSLWVDDINSNDFTILLGRNSSKKKIAINKNSVISYKEVKSLNGNDCIVEIDDVFQLGLIASFDNIITGTITSLTITLNDDNIYSFKYNISENISYNKSKFLCENQSCTFEAKVINNDDNEKLGRIQVSFKDDTKVDNEFFDNEKFWINIKQSNSSNAGGFIFIPNINDIVTVSFYNDKFLIENTLRNDKFPENMDNVNYRYIFNIYNKSISLTEECIEIKSKENTLTLSDKDTLLKVGEYQAVLDKDKFQIDIDKSKVAIFKDNINISVGDTKIKVSNKDIILNVGKSKVKISDDFELSATNVSFKANSDIKADATKKITLKGNGGIGMN